MRFQTLIPIAEYDVSLHGKVEIDLLLVIPFQGKSIGGRPSSDENVWDGAAIRMLHRQYYKLMRRTSSFTVQPLFVAEIGYHQLIARG